MTARWRPVAMIAALISLGAAAVTLGWQVEVGDPSRSCGSAFDAVADRSGWQIWWAQDLDEATPDRPSDLVRTRDCPDAVNLRMIIASVLGGGGVLLAGVAWWAGPSRRSGRAPLERLAMIATAAGVALTLAGVAAIVLLVADADSTLFLYTDRLVVAVVGLIALVPALALAFGGWALHTVVRSDGEEGEDGGDERDA